MPANKIRTEDGQTVCKGDRVFNYYDCKWGMIVTDPDPHDGWFDVKHVDGTSALLNGARISTFDPDGTIHPCQAAMSNIQFAYWLCDMMDTIGVSHWWVDTYPGHKFAFMRNEAPHFSDMFPW